MKVDQPVTLLVKEPVADLVDDGNSAIRRLHQTTVFSFETGDPAGMGSVGVHASSTGFKMR